MSWAKELKLRGRQGARFARLGVNLSAGSAFIAACFRFPALSKIDSKALNDYRAFTFWVKDLAYSMNTKVRVSGDIMPEHGLFVSNHISWLDTIVFNHLRPSSFIARHDLQHWPLLGTFTQRMESIYIDRSNKFQAYRCIPNIEDKLNQGRSVHLFPESTTSDGRQVLPFFPMFYESAVRTGVKVQPVRISYTDQEGNHIAAPAFIDDDSFFDTLERMMRADKIFANVHYMEPLDANVLGRKRVCQESRNMIEESLKRFYSR